MRDPSARCAEARDAVRVQFYAVRVPHILAEPTEFFGVLGRRAIEFFARVRNVVIVFRKMRVQAYASTRERAREQCGLAH